MAGGGFLDHMRRALDYNKSLLKNKGFFNDANAQGISRKSIYQFKKAGRKKLQSIRLNSRLERKREVRKIAAVAAVAAGIAITLITLLLYFI